VVADVDTITPVIVVTRALSVHGPFLNPTVVKLRVTDRSPDAAATACVATTVSVPPQFISRLAVKTPGMSAGMTTTTSIVPETLLRTAAFPS
jgi:hypothetical protein